MGGLIEALAEPWARWWGSQNMGAAVAFWTVGLIAFLTRHPFSFHCAPASDGAWCRIHQAGGFGTGLVVVAAAAAVAGSAILVAALTPWLIRVLAGEAWPYRGLLVLPSRSLVRWLIRRQMDARGRTAALGEPVSDPPAPPAQPDLRRRRENHRALAAYAANRTIDRVAAARLRRYPADPGAYAPTRIGCALAAMTERVSLRHGLELADCWEPLLVVCPDSARQLLASESRRVTQRGQGLIWSLAALAWTVLLPPAGAVCWAVAALAAAWLLHAGLQDAVGTYCDLVEGTVAAYRHLLYRSLGLPLPIDTAAEASAGALLSAYLTGAQAGTLAMPLSWPAVETAAETPPQAVVAGAEGEHSG